MKSISAFALDLLDDLSHRFNDGDRWELTVRKLGEFGFNALNLASFSPATGIINWARTSMSQTWLETYSNGGYAEADPVLAQTTNGIDSLYVNTETRSAEANSARAVALYSGLKNAGYNHIFSLAVPCPGDEARMVVLSSNHPEAEQMMVDQAREMRILATVLGTNLGPETGEGESGIHDLVPVLAGAVPLSAREQETLAHLATGLRNDQIAEQMGIKEITVRTHLKSARDKLHAPTREAALVRAVQLGMVSMKHHRKR